MLPEKTSANMLLGPEIVVRTSLPSYRYEDIASWVKVTYTVKHVS